jgi:hypothetical protein
MKVILKKLTSKIFFTEQMKKGSASGTSSTLATHESQNNFIHLPGSEMVKSHYRGEISITIYRSNFTSIFVATRTTEISRAKLPMLD